MHASYQAINDIDWCLILLAADKCYCFGCCTPIVLNYLSLGMCIHCKQLGQ